MLREKLSKRPWYPYAMGGCVVVLVYVLLTHVGSIYGGFRKILGYFSTVFLAAVLAYLMNPIANFYSRRVLRRIRSQKLRKVLANALAVLSVILFFALALVLLIPQLVDSIRVFSDNLDGYVSALEGTLSSLGIFKGENGLNLQELLSSSENLVDRVMSYVVQHLTAILTTSAGAGRQLMNWAIAFILSIYLLSEKEMLKAGLARLLGLILKPSSYQSLTGFLRRCDAILARYITYNLLDSLIVGLSNALFMTIWGMPYAGLVSFVVAITNLIPTFGPVVGAVIGAFILLLIRPMHALVFLVFTLILQTLDGYVLKPRLFGNTLGVSGLWILIAVIVGGRVFGVVGILLAIPGAAILDFLYHEKLIPWLEARKAAEEKPEEPAFPAEGQSSQMTE